MHLKSILKPNIPCSSSVSCGSDSFELSSTSSGTFQRRKTWYRSERDTKELIVDVSSAMTTALVANCLVGLPWLVLYLTSNNTVSFDGISAEISIAVFAALPALICWRLMKNIEFSYLIGPIVVYLLLSFLAGVFVMNQFWNVVAGSGLDGIAKEKFVEELYAGKCSINNVGEIVCESKEVQAKMFKYSTFDFTSWFGSDKTGHVHMCKSALNNFDDIAWCLAFGGVVQNMTLAYSIGHLFGFFLLIVNLLTVVRLVTAFFNWSFLNA